jgi:hypothetical protein
MACAHQRHVLCRFSVLLATLRKGVAESSANFSMGNEPLCCFWRVFISAVCESGTHSFHLDLYPFGLAVCLVSLLRVVVVFCVDC